MIAIEQWGIIPFDEAWERQRELALRVEQGLAPSTLVLCQHPSVITIGRTGSQTNVIAARELLQGLGINVVEIDRGGDATLHNPGQLVGYPIFNLTDFKQDLHWFLREIEQCIIDAIAEYGLVGDRVDGLTGVWIEEQRKVCAIGIHCRRWITYHGFALNVCNDLNEFSYIIPCGITDKAVTSVQAECKTQVTVDEISAVVAERFLQSFAVTQ
jgi:lipoate-protein ligase B